MAAGPPIRRCSISISLVTASSSNFALELLEKFLKMRIGRTDLGIDELRTLLQVGPNVAHVPPPSEPLQNSSATPQYPGWWT